jgi:hypothetical protein
LAVLAAVESGTPEWARIHAMIAAELVPSARITERSMTSPPEA